MRKNIIYVFLLVLSLACSKDKTTGLPVNTEEFKAVDSSEEQSHPSLILTKKGVADIKANLGSIPIFDKTVAAAQAELDLEIENGFDVPIPKDYSGGYTHETHKKNYTFYINYNCHFCSGGIL